jgi:hypothetical protein
MSVLSVDLAYLDYRDFGVAVLDKGSSGATCELLSFANGSAQAPTPDHTADVVIDMCRRFDASLLVLDGPQGWKDRLNGLAHSRICERTLNAPAKTGLPGNTKPANYLRFIEFAIQVFDALHRRGWGRFDPTTWRPGDSAVIESLPLAAWRSLGLRCLPAKRKARGNDILDGLQSLVNACVVDSACPTPTHDQLQAIVGGLGGLGILTGDKRRYTAVGAPPLIIDGVWREGYIVNPVRDGTTGALASLG